MSPAPDASAPPPIPAAGVTRDDVIWCYRLALGREPESQAAIDSKLKYSNRAELFKAFLAGPEFQNSEKGRTARAFFPNTSPPIIVECDPPREQLTRLFERVRRTWSSLGEAKPHWSVLSSSEFLPENIAASQGAFYRSGAGEANVLLATLKRVGREAAEFPTIHEFGCGLGRMTNHLAALFEEVIGLDISASHLKLAREHSAAIGAGNISYREVSMPDFGMREEIDLWYSVIVLQHNPPPVISAVLRRAFARLRPGGIAVFQVPTYQSGYSFGVDKYLETPAREGAFEMHVLLQSAVFDLVRKADCRLLEVIEDGRTAHTRFLSNTFVVERPDASPARRTGGLNS